MDQSSALLSIGRPTMSLTAPDFTLLVLKVLV